MQRPAQGEIGTHRPIKGVHVGAFATPFGLKIWVVHHPIGDAEPVSRRRFGVGAIRPEFRQHTGVVPARHQLFLIGRSCGRVEGMALAGVSPMLPVVKLVVLRVTEVQKRGVDIAHRRRADVQHDAVGGVQMFRPAQHHGMSPCVGILDALGIVQGQERWFTLVQPNRVGMAVVAHVHRAHTVRQPKRRHLSPFGAEERRGFRFWNPTLANECAEVDALPAVGLGQEGIAWHGLDEHVRVGGRVVLVGVTVDLVAPVGVTIGQDLLRDVVAKGCRSIHEVVGALHAVDASLQRELLEDGHQGRIASGTS